jgi:hypothetical protein
MSITKAAELGAKLRFRAVMMAPIAFIVGLAPLVWAAGLAITARFALRRRRERAPVYVRSRRSAGRSPAARSVPRPEGDLDHQLLQGDGKPWQIAEVREGVC